MVAPVLDVGIVPREDARAPVADGYAEGASGIAYGMIQSVAEVTTAELWEQRNTRAARRVPGDLSVGSRSEDADDLSTMRNTEPRKGL